MRTELQAYDAERGGALAAAGNWVKDNWEYIAGGAMAIAGGVLIATGVGNSEAHHMTNTQRWATYAICIPIPLVFLYFQCVFAHSALVEAGVLAG